MNQTEKPKVGTSYREILEESRNEKKKRPKDEYFDSSCCDSKRRFRDDDADCFCDD